MSKRTELAEQGQSALIASMPGHLQGFVRHAIGRIGALGDDEESLWRASEAGEKMEMAGRLIAGCANMALAARTEKKLLLEKVRARGLFPQRFFEGIALYRAYEALPDGHKVEAMAELGFSKSRSLLPWSPEERLALACGEEVRGVTLAEAIAMPSREFDQATKPARESDLERSNVNLKAEVQTLRAELKTANSVAPPGLTRADRRRREIKLKAHGLSELVQRFAGELARLAEPLNEGELYPQTPDDLLADKALCTGLLIEVEAAKATVDEVLASLRERLQGRVDVRSDAQPVMTPNECFEARRRRAVMAEMKQKELDTLNALAYARDDLDGVAERGAPPRAVKKLRRKTGEVE